jgi:hypothetical protein
LKSESFLLLPDVLLESDRHCERNSYIFEEEAVHKCLGVEITLGLIKVRCTFFFRISLSLRFHTRVTVANGDSPTAFNTLIVIINLLKVLLRYAFSNTENLDDT